MHQDEGAQAFNSGTGWGSRGDEDKATRQIWPFLVKKRFEMVGSTSPLFMRNLLQYR